MDKHKSMERLNNIPNLGAYNTAVKDIAGIQDVSKFYDIFNAQRSMSTYDELDIAGFLTDIRTEKTRQKVAWAIKKSVLCYLNLEHRQILEDIFSKNIPITDKHFAFFYHLNLTNRLFREISIHVFAKVYFSGRASISQNDIIPYIKEIKNDAGTPLWTDNTIYRLATKYLSLMTKLGFVSSARVKSFKHIRPSSETQVLFLYFAKLRSPSASNILTNELLPISFVPSEDVQDRLKKLSLKGFFNMSFNGVVLNIELTHSYKGICDVLYH